MNIYISNLSYAVNDGDLKDLFGEYGEISSAKVITDRETGRSRGFGFVEMADDAQGQKAIDELNQAEYDGKVINVTVARPRTERPAGNRGGFHRNNNFNGERKERRYESCGGCLIRVQPLFQLLNSLCFYFHICRFHFFSILFKFCFHFFYITKLGAFNSLITLKVSDPMGLALISPKAT